VNLVLRPEWNVNFTKAHMLAPDGRCKTFDASADGYTRGEGCGWSCCSGCRTPSRQRAHHSRDPRLGGEPGRRERRADGAERARAGAGDPPRARAAGVRPGEVGYVEAHGTGTSLGRSDRGRGARRGVRRGALEGGPLAIGSVKTNVGHLEAAAGVAGLMKVALSLQHGEIAAAPALPDAEPAHRLGWAARRGAGRADAVAIGRCAAACGHQLVRLHRHQRARGSRRGTAGPGVRAPAGEPASNVERPVHVMPHDRRPVAPALRALAARYERHLGAHPELPLADVAFTAGTGRAHFRHRLAVVAPTHRGCAAEAGGRVPRW
jgi:hypothetical protein